MAEKNVVVNISPKTIILILISALLVWLFFVLREVVILIFLSFIFSAALDPAIDRLEKKKVPRVAAIGAIYVLVIILFLLIIRNVIPPAISQMTALVQNKELYIEKVLVYIKSISPDLRDTIKATALNMISTLSAATKPGIISSTLGFFSGIAGFIAVLVISFYLLLEKDGTEKWISSNVPKKFQAKTLSISKKIMDKMSAWFRGQLLLALIVFVVTFLGLTLLRIDFALTLAIIAGFMEMLPIIGPVISGGLAALVALTVSPLLALIVIIFFTLVHQLENHILVPQIMKKAVGLHPVAIIFALLAGGKLLGILGIIIAVPVAASISVLFRELYKNNLGEN